MLIWILVAALVLLYYFFVMAPQNNITMSPTMQRSTMATMMQMPPGMTSSGMTSPRPFA